MIALTFSSARLWLPWQNKNPGQASFIKLAHSALHWLVMELRRQSGVIFLVIVFSIAGSLCAAAQKQQQSFYIKPDQTADLPNDAKLTTAKQTCENWALAAGLETMLRQQNVPLDQSFWVMRLAGGELCIDNPPKMEALAQTVNREFVLDDGRHVRLETHFTAGPPVNIDPIIAGLKLQQVSLLIWNNHPYFLTGITYDERIGRDGTRFFEVKEMRLANTFPKLPGVTFEKGRDNPNDIQGILTVTVAQ